MKKQLIFYSLLVLLIFSWERLDAESSEPENATPTGVIEKTGQYLPLEARFTAQDGSSVTLGQLITKPTLLLPVYYRCPQSCSFDMANLAFALQNTSLPNQFFNVITLSFDHNEHSDDAAKAKRNYGNLIQNDFPVENWSFLTGAEKNILKVTDSIGYSFKKAEDGLFLHPSAMVAVAEDGKIIKYIYGSFLSGDVDLALSEAGKGTPATSIKRFLNYCISGEIKNNKTVFTVMKISIIVVVMIGGGLLLRLLLKKR